MAVGSLYTFPLVLQPVDETGVVVVCLLGISMSRLQEYETCAGNVVPGKEKPKEEAVGHVLA